MIYTDPPIDPADYAVRTEPPASEPVPKLDFPRFFMQDLLREDATTLTTNSELASRPVELLADGFTYDFWKAAAGAGDVTLEADAGEGVPIDYMMFVRHNLGTSGATVHAESSPDGSTWTDRLEISPEDDGPSVLLFPEVTERYWRLRIERGTSAPRIAVLKIGQSFVMPHKIYVGNPPITASRNTRLISTISEGGQSLGKSLVRSMLENQVNFKNLTPEFYYDEFDPDIVVPARTEYFGFAWRPGAFPDQVAYCEATSDIQPSPALANRFIETQVRLRGLDV